MNAPGAAHGRPAPVRAGRPLGCWLVALLSGWVTMVFVSSALIVLRDVPNAMTRSGVGHPGPIAATWRVADEMAPAAKLLLVALFAALVWLGERWGPPAAAAGREAPRPPRPWDGYAVNVALGAVAMVLTLALLPAAYSRGFGVGLTGARLDPVVLPLYLASAALGAVVYTVSVTRCRAARNRGLTLR